MVWYTLPVLLGMHLLMLMVMNAPHPGRMAADSWIKVNYQGHAIAPQLLLRLPKVKLSMVVLLVLPKVLGGKLS
jgi:hypothetical protein